MQENTILKWDGHTHTPYCMHGTDAAAEQYVERALALGFERYTVSEHPPLPAEWVKDPVLMQELAMTAERLPDYMDHMLRMKERYAAQIDVTVGLEIDYLYRHETFAEAMIEKWQHVLEDIVISVHYLPGKDGMRCLDFKPAYFRDAFLDSYGSMEQVVHAYFDHVEMAIEWGKKFDVRKRIGHLNLIEKFHRELPPFHPDLLESRLRRLLPKLAAAGFGVDVNVAGMRVATCGKPYVPPWFMRECHLLGIPLVYGSDAHHPDHVGAEWDWFEHQLRAIMN